MTRPREDVLAELTVVEAQRRRLERRHGALLAEASRAGVTQAELAQRFEVTQATMSRWMRRVRSGPEAERAAAVEEAVEDFETGELDTESFVSRLLELGEGPLPAFDQAVLRGTIGLEVAGRLEEARSAGLSERERLARIDPDALAGLLRDVVHAAVAQLQQAGDSDRAAELARRGRTAPARDVDERLDLVFEARAVLGSRGATVAE